MKGTRTRKSKQEIVKFLEDEGKKEFPIHISKQALIMIDTMGDEFDYDDFAQWVKENFVVAGGHVMKYLQGKGLLEKA